MSKVLLSQPDFGLWTLDFGPLLFDSEQRLAILDWLTILNVNLCNFSGSLSLYFIHQLHRFNDTDHGISFDLAADLYKRISCGRASAIKCADYR